MLNLLIQVILLVSSQDSALTSNFRMYETAPDKITFHYMKVGGRIGTLKRLANSDTSIKFAMNGCMFTAGDYEPVGLYVEKGKLISSLVLVKHHSTENFGISQGVFYIDRAGRAGIVDANQAKPSSYYYAVELAPRLVINGKVNPRVIGMTDHYIRNGIGIMSDGHVVFLETIRSVSMEQFANKFKSLGCVNAVYVDGGVSESWRKGEAHPDIAGEFGPMVAAH